MIATVFCILPITSVNATTLAITLSNSTPSIGDQITASLTVSDITDLVSFNFDLGFDTNQLSVDSVQPGSFLGGGGLTLSDLGLFGNDLSISGQIQDINNGLLGAPTGVSGDGVLATIVFNVNAQGSSILDWLNLGQTNGTVLLDSTLNTITLDQSLSATVTATAPVPLPAALWLALSSLVFYPSMKKITQESSV
jgi:hypothetical protein